ncbi:MAG: hypothetical protein LBM19_01630 [Holosporales bacterium]|jgi:hypothetical protein|nr:hypothetical protein [Holosporales bacterium]
MINLKNWKYLVYYGARFLGWQIIFNIPARFIDKMADMALADYPYSNLVFGVLEVVWDIFAVKFSLGKVFFKKYKKIELTPKIEKISWGMPIKILLTTTTAFLFLTMLYLSVTVGLDGFEAAFEPSRLQQWLGVFLLILTLALASQIAMVKHYVEKYAIISEKVITEITHD